MKWNTFGRNVYAWGLVHAGDRYGEPLCRIRAMSAPSHNVDDIVTCLYCLAIEGSDATQT